MTGWQEMDIRLLAPPPQLANAVKCYYYIDNPHDSLVYDTFFADGCVEAVFSLGWEFYSGGQREDWAKVIGQIVKPRRLAIKGRGRSFGVWFYPHTFSYFTRVPLHEMNDSVIPWDDLFSRDLCEFIGNCLSDGSIERLVAGVNRFLIGKLIQHQRKRMDNVIAFAVDDLLQKGIQADLDSLARQLNVSHRSLQRGFLERVGYSQKHFLRVARFQDALRDLREGAAVSLTEVAHANDYFDQAHFNREFKRFTGFAPSAFRAIKLPINQYFLGVR